MPSKRGVAVLLLACALVVAGVLWSTSRNNSDTFHYRPDPAGARQLAAQACGAFGRFVTVANDNGPATEVTSLLERFEARAQAAYDKDVRWTRLLSAAKALRAGFDADDASATRVGYDLAREECRR